MHFSILLVGKLEYILNITIPLIYGYTRCIIIMIRHCSRMKIQRGTGIVRLISYSEFSREIR